MTARATGQRFRQRKLSTKQNLPVVRESEVEQLADDDASRHIPKVETGVEKGEEIVSRTRPLLASTPPLPTLSSHILTSCPGTPFTSRHLRRPGSSARRDWWEDCTTLHSNSGCCRKHTAI
jgi:hypothetical protein